MTRLLDFKAKPGSSDDSIARRVVEQMYRPSAFFEYCLNNPEERAVDAVAKIEDKALTRGQADRDLSQSSSAFAINKEPAFDAEVFFPKTRLVPAAAPMPGHTCDGRDGYEHYGERHCRHDASV